MAYPQIGSEDEQGAEGFWITFCWVIAFIIAAQVFWLLLLHRGGTQVEVLVLPFAVSISLLIVIAVFQQLKAPKVYPLSYISPMMNIVILQGLLIVGMPSVSGLVSLVIFYAAANAMLLALAWDDVSNISTSGISELWLSIMPVACFVMLGSASLLGSVFGWEVDQMLALQLLMWGFIWLGVAVSILLFFTLRRQRRILPREDWQFPPLLLVATLITIILGPILVIATGFGLHAIFIAITVGLVEFGVASAELEPLLRHEIGKHAASVSFATGYMLSFVCVLFSWLVIMPWPFV